MTALAARQETLRLIDDIPDDEMPRLLLLVKSFRKPATRADEERETTEAAATPDEERRARIHAAVQEGAGLWCWHNDQRTPDEIARDLRRGRQFDIR